MTHRNDTSPGTSTCHRVTSHDIEREITFGPCILFCVGARRCLRQACTFWSGLHLAPFFHQGAIRANTVVGREGVHAAPVPQQQEWRTVWDRENLNVVVTCEWISVGGVSLLEIWIYWKCEFIESVNHSANPHEPIQNGHWYKVMAWVVDRHAGPSRQLVHGELRWRHVSRHAPARSMAGRTRIFSHRTVRRKKKC